MGEKKRVAVLEVGEGGLPCDTVDEAYALLDEYTFESVRVAVNGRTRFWNSPTLRG